MLPLFRLIALLWGLLVFPVTAFSHPLDPALLELVSRNGHFDVLWKGQSLK